MNRRENFSWSNGHLLGLTCMLFGAAAVFHLASAAAGHPFYRDQHLGTALDYARHGINLFKPVIIGFNATNTPTPLEFPLWQAAAAVAFKLLGGWFGWANLVSLLLFATCLFPLFRLAQDYFGARCAWWTLVFFVAQPIIFINAGTAGTDGFSLATAVWFLYCALGLLKNPRPGWWAATCLTGGIAALSKLPFFLAAGLACFFMAARFHRHTWRPWIYLGSAAGVIGVLFLAWTRYTDRCLALAEFPVTDLRLSDPQTAFWYFGDWHYRLTPWYWIKGGWRLLNECFGSFALTGLFAYGLIFLKGSPLAKLWALGGVITTMIFTHLVLHHSHYYLMFSPPVAMLCGLAATELEKKFPAGTQWKSLLALAGVASVLGLSLLQGLIGGRVVLNFDRYPGDIAKIIAQHSGESDKLLVRGGGWGGDLLILSHREGMDIWSTEVLENPANFRRLKQLGFNRLVMISESPLLAAIEKSNPGQTQAVRESYRNFLTPVAKDWPTLFENEDILIKQIP